MKTMNESLKLGYNKAGMKEAGASVTKVFLGIIGLFGVMIMVISYFMKSWLGTIIGLGILIAMIFAITKVGIKKWK